MKISTSSQPPLPPNKKIDFICARGGDAKELTGNKSVLDRIEFYWPDYCKAKKANDKKDFKADSKRGLAYWEIVKYFQARGVRFMEKGPDGTYFELDDEAATDKVEQKFRDALKRIWERLTRDNLRSNPVKTKYNGESISLEEAIERGVDKRHATLKTFVLEYQLAEREFVKEKGLEVVEALLSQKHGWAFKDPVDAVELGLPHYHEVIKRPMDLGTIRKELQGDCYRSFKEFVSDVYLTFDNATLYNREEAPLYKMAKEMKAMFNLEIKNYLGLLQAEKDAGSKRKAKQQGKDSKPKRQKKENGSLDNENSNLPLEQSGSVPVEPLQHEGAYEDADSTPGVPQPEQSEEPFDSALTNEENAEIGQARLQENDKSEPYRDAMHEFW